MKTKIKYLLLTIIAFLLCITNVNAIKVGDSVSLRYGANGSDSGVHFSNNLNYRPDTFSSTVDGQSYNLVCLNPGTNAKNGMNLKVKGISPMDADYYGLSVIMKEGSSNYLAMTIASRAYVYNHLPSIASTKSCAYSDSSKCSIQKNELKQQAINWEKNGSGPLKGTTSTGQSVLVQAKTIYMKGVEARNSYQPAESGGAGDPTVTATLISSGDSGKKDNSFSMGESNEEGGSNTTKQLQVVEFKLTNFPKDSANFSYDGVKVENAKDGFTAKEVGVSFTRSTDASAFTESISKGTNVFEAFASNVKEEENTKSLTFYVAIETTVSINNDDDDSDDTECGGDAKVLYSYKTKSVKSDSQIIHLTSNNSSLQDFLAIMVNTNNTEEEQTFEGEVPLKKMNCESDPCKPAVCIDDDCEYDKTIPQVCEDGMEMDEEGNVEYKFLEAYQNGKYSIKKCLLKGQKDAAGNPYKLVDQANAAAVADNPYCSIMCKEDYVFKLPYKRQTEEGRYFNIEMSLKGQQDCYSTALDYEQFNQDILDKTVEIMEAYNEWAEYYELVNNLLVEDTETIECKKNTCVPKNKIDYSKTPPVVTSEVEACWYGEITTSKIEKKKKIQFGTNANVKYFTNPTLSMQVEDNTTGEVKILTADTSHLKKPDDKKFGKLKNQNAGTCSVNAQKTGCDLKNVTCDILTADKDYEEQKSTFESKLKQAKTNVEQKVEELKEIIDELNSCNGDHNYQAISKKFSGSAFWDMIYQYDPEIKYSYDEPDPTNTSIPKWIEDVRAITCDSDTCDVMFSKDEEVQAESCGSGSANCSSVGATGKVQSIFSTEEEPEELDVNTYCIGDIEGDYTCKGQELHSLDDSAYVDSKFWICEFKNNIFECEEKEYKQTAIDYIHKTAVASGKYETRRVYYTGHDDGDVRVDAPDQKIDNYSLVNGLPVAANTPQGTYFYILAIDNIGTFYSTGELGRVYGTNPQSLLEYARSLNTYQNQVIITNDNTTEVTKEIATNEYACSYDVSENSCTDGSGNYHTIDECDFGKDGQDANWDACKERICPGGSPGSGSVCVKTAEKYYSCTSENYSEDSCTEYPDRQSAIAASGTNYNCCPNCTVACVGRCLIVVENDEPNDAKLQVDFRTITTANMNPNNRQLGYNWDSQNGSNHLVAQKAGNTISEIEARAGGQASYPGMSTVSDYALKVTMTPDMATWIKKYNNEQLDNGNYNNDTLECYDYTLSNIRDEETCNKAGYIWQNNTSCVMANVFCYSKFIDNLEISFGNQISFGDNGYNIRDKAKNSAHSNFQAYKQVSSGGSSSEIKTNDYWTIYEYSSLDVNGDSIPDIGPSWK